LFGDGVEPEDLFLDAERGVAEHREEVEFAAGAGDIGVLADRADIASEREDEFGHRAESGAPLVEELVGDGEAPILGRDRHQVGPQFGPQDALEPAFELGDLDEAAPQDGFAGVGGAHRAGEGLTGFLAREDAERRARAGEFRLLLFQALQCRFERLATERGVGLVTQVFDGLGR
jgi:hypothetical protein